MNALIANIRQLFLAPRQVRTFYDRKEAADFAVQRQAARLAFTGRS